MAKTLETKDSSGNYQEWAKAHNLEKAKFHLNECRAGRIADHGYNLWVHASILTNMDVSYEQLGTSQEELKAYLVQDLKKWIENFRNETEDIEEVWWAFVTMDAYFFDRSNLRKDEFNLSYEDIGTTEDEYKQLLHRNNVRAWRQELKKCRSTGPTKYFWGLKQDLKEGEVTLEEIGATEGEIDKLTTIYKEKYPWTAL